MGVLRRSWQRSSEDPEPPRVCFTFAFDHFSIDGASVSRRTPARGTGSSEGRSTHVRTARGAAQAAPFSNKFISYRALEEEFRFASGFYVCQV